MYGVLYGAFKQKSNEDAWDTICNMLDPAFLQSLLRDPDVSPKLKEVALLLLLVIASDSICKGTSDEAKRVLAELEGVQFCQEHNPYTYETDAILQKMDSVASMSSENHQCDKCVAVPNLGNIADGSSCSKYNCPMCLHFADGRDTAHKEEGDTHACPAMQKTMAWANMVRALVPLARVVANSSKYKNVSEEFALPFKVWRCFYCFWALPMLFTAKKSLKYLQNALGIFEDQTRCANVLWRHVSLLLHMQKVLQMKVRFPLKGESSTENRKTLAEFQEKYGQFLPPITSPAPPLSQ